MAVSALPLWGCTAAGMANGPGSATRDRTARQWSDTLAGIERAAQGRLGVAMLDTGSGLALGWRQDERFAMASTFKLVLAGWLAGCLPWWTRAGSGWMRACTTRQRMWWRIRP
ncbi:hypothetical protein [Acidovorax carolinensis]|uniref:hypothetical protein n=1 Tax=Acidovorax carolinensis TaxID=553814 RepID=UPI003AAE8928